jgi:hypothetical protein
MAVSTYSDWSAAKCPGATGSALNPSLTQDSLNRLNWLLNNYYSPITREPKVCILSQEIPQNQYFAHFDQRSTLPGTYSITGLDMQAAVWTLTGGLKIAAVRLLCAQSVTGWRLQCVVLILGLPVQGRHLWKVRHCSRHRLYV